MEDNKKEIEETTKAVEEAKKQGDKVEEISTEKGDIVVITKETPVDTDVEEAPKGEKKALDFSAAVEIDSEESK
jgi:hypothetical protein